MPTPFKDAPGSMEPGSSREPARLKPVTDLSPEAVSIGRMIDRLEPGRYMIELNKPESRADGWPINISSIITIRDINLKRS